MRGWNFCNNFNLKDYLPTRFVLGGIKNEIFMQMCGNFFEYFHWLEWFIDVEEENIYTHGMEEAAFYLHRKRTCHEYWITSCCISGYLRHSKLNICQFARVSWLIFPLIHSRIRVGLISHLIAKCNLPSRSYS